MCDYFVHESAYVDKGAVIGKGSSIWHFSHIMSGAELGEGCTLGQNVFVQSNVIIGNHCKIQNNVSVYEGVVLEDYVFCGPSMVFTNVKDPRCKYPQRGSEFYAETVVREGTSIGANATIVCGNTIGRHAFIGSGAVVTGDVPDYALMVGVPAKRVGWACECGQILPGFESNIRCPRCGMKYCLKENGRLIHNVQE
ncbi:MAG: N-acetyltransferase [Candidatus Aegiribacteria sp.]|nr:N-acetyltransferase [Candidatus Aegiribacteria sp.]